MLLLFFAYSFVFEHRFVCPVRSAVQYCFAPFEINLRPHFCQGPHWNGAGLLKPLPNISVKTEGRPSHCNDEYFIAFSPSDGRFATQRKCLNRLSCLTLTFGRVYTDRDLRICFFPFSERLLRQSMSSPSDCLVFRSG